MPVLSTSSPPCSRRPASASSIACTQRTAVPSRSAPASTRGRPRRTTGRSRISASVGSDTSSRIPAAVEHYAAPAAGHRSAAVRQTRDMTDDLLARHRAVLPNWMALNYEHPLEITSGKGCRVTDAEGRSYLDFFGGILTNMLGYDVPEVREAVERQLATGVVHTSTLYLIRHQVELAEKIARLSGIENAKVFFTNSGTEANETALMLATAARRSNQVLALRNSYHGRSFGAVAITGNGAWKSSPLAPFSVHYLHGTDRDRPAFAGMDDDAYTAACVQDLRHVLATATAGDVACLIAEPVQGVGGFTMPPDGLLGEYAAVLRERGALLISDEVQTAWGRTGEHFWGIGAHGVVPDMITFAKGLGNGFAIGGVIARGDLMDGLPGSGISTFGGNPLSTTAASASLDYLLDHDLQANAAVLGSMIITGLAEAAA